MTSNDRVSDPLEMDLSELHTLFEYDRGKPFDLQETLVREENGVRLLDIHYTSPVFGRITAYLVVPEGRGPFPCVIFGHLGYAVRTQYLWEAMLYGEAGAVSLLVDHPYVRPAPWRKRMRGPFAEDFVEEKDGYIQGVIDLRRSLDFLESLPYCDGERLAYVGHSIGAQFGAILASLEKRLKAVILVGGVPASEDIYLKSDDPDMVWLRENMGEKVDEFIKTLRVVDAIYYIPHAAPIPLFFQFAEFERYFDEASMKRYFEAASEPKGMKWYPTGHELADVRALIDRANWLREKIGMGSVVPILKRELDE